MSRNICNNSKVVNDTFVIHEGIEKSVFIHFINFTTKRRKNQMLKNQELNYQIIIYNTCNNCQHIYESSEHLVHVFIYFLRNWRKTESRLIHIRFSNLSFGTLDYLILVLVLLLTDNQKLYMRKIISVSLPEELITQVDKKREDISRSRFFRRALERQLERGK